MPNHHNFTESFCSLQRPDCNCIQSKDFRHHTLFTLLKTDVRYLLLLGRMQPNMLVKVHDLFNHLLDDIVLMPAVFYQYQAADWQIKWALFYLGFFFFRNGSCFVGYLMSLLFSCYTVSIVSSCVLTFHIGVVEHLLHFISCIIQREVL